MEQIKLYQIDTFTKNPFKGNPAGVCPLEEWLTDETMQNIAFENNLPETAFYVKKGSLLEIRWFSPTVEVDLCGHATLACAFVEFERSKVKTDTIIFHSKSGELSVRRKDNLLTLDFPVDEFSKINLTTELTTPFNYNPIEAYKGSTDIMLVFSNEEEIENMKPILAEVAKINARGVIVTARGKEFDFVSRFFAPQSGINEDPVTGSAHTALIPYWSNVLGKKVMKAWQLSERGGELLCELDGDRVKISGNAVLYMEGNILV